MKRGKRRDIIIELTSLLDVIMIMIFMVMAENSKLIDEKQTALEAAQEENIAKDGEIEELNGRLEGLSEELLEALGKLDEGSLEELLERLREAESRLDSYEYIDDVMIVLNVKLENKYENTVRYLTYGSSDAPGSERSHEIRGSDDLTAAINNLKVFVSDYTKRINGDEKNSAIVYVVFSYNADTVFQDDYAAVNNALKDMEIKANSGNFRYRLKPSDADDQS